MKLTHRLGAKIAAVIICLITAVTAEIGIVGSILYIDEDIYWQTDVRKAYFEYINNYSLYREMQELCQRWDILQLLMDEKDVDEYMQSYVNDVYGEWSNRSILIINGNQEEVYRTYQGEEIGLEMSNIYNLSSSVQDMLDNGYYGYGSRIYYSSQMNQYYIHLYDAEELLGYEIIEELVRQGKVRVYIEGEEAESSVYYYEITEPTVAESDRAGSLLMGESQSGGGIDILDIYTLDGNTILYFPNLQSCYSQEERELTLHSYIDYNLPVEDSYRASYQNFERFFQLRYVALAVAVISVMLLLAGFVFLLFAAGHRGKGDEIVLNPIDRIPTEIYLLIIGTIALFGVRAIDDFTRGIIEICLFIYFVFLIVFMASLTLATRLKAGTVVKNSICGRVFSILFELVKDGLGIISDILHHLPVVWKGVLIAFGFAGIEFFFLAWAADGVDGLLVLLWLFTHIFIGLLICRNVLSLYRIVEAGKHFSEGNWDYKVDTRRLHGELKRYGEYLNNIGQDMNRTVEARMKSERFKTELITNVSHDIKTPLTSIINYVDLLKKEEMPNDSAKQYLEVLERQSARLKKLIVDLIEASKASTGNVAVELVPMDVAELVIQVSAEYERRFAEKNLATVLSLPDENALIMADGRHMWRILDNILNNALKYSQEGTRIYIDVIVDGGQVILTVKNISNCALNISSDELMERFVRGDSSRNTEGSGLGLSIARSLTELQKGKLTLMIDGDLFKVILTFEGLEA